MMKTLLSEKAIDELTNYYLQTARLYHETTDEDVKEHIKDILSHSWNVLGGNSVTPTLASEKALTEAKTRKLVKELVEMRWGDQPKEINKGGMGDKGRKMFHWEHAYTRSDFVAALLSFPSDVKLEEVKKLIKQHQIVWILKVEDKKLTDAGYNSKRPNGWQEAYKELGIIVDEKNK